MSVYCDRWEREKECTGVIWLNSFVSPSRATYGASLNSGLSVAEPKYNFPAAFATRAKPAVDVPEGADADEAAVVGGVSLAVEELCEAVQFTPFWRTCQQKLRIWDTGSTKRRYRCNSNQQYRSEEKIKQRLLAKYAKIRTVGPLQSMPPPR